MLLKEPEGDMRHILCSRMRRPGFVRPPALPDPLGKIPTGWYFFVEFEAETKLYGRVKG